MTRGRPTRPSEIAARLRAAEGARLVVANPSMTHHVAAEQTNSTVWAVTEAYLVLTKGTPEEISKFEDGEASLRALTDTIRARQPKNVPQVRKAQPGRASLMTEQESRVRAFQAARLSLKDGLSLDDAAAKIGINRRTVSTAVVIIRHGSEDTVRGVESGEMSLISALRTIHATVSPEERRLTRKRNIYSEETRQARDTEIAIWNSLRVALENIAGLPQPTDVVKLIKKHRVRGETVNEKLISAYAWITEFSDEWTK